MSNSRYLRTSDTHSQCNPPDFGESLPYFSAQTDGVANYSIDVAAGRWIVLMAFHSLGDREAKSAHDEVLKCSHLFNDADAAFFGISIDPTDRSQRGLANASAGRRYFWDFEQKVAPMFGGRPSILLIDRGFRVVKVAPLSETIGVLRRLEEELAAEPPMDQASFAPILTLPRIFEPEFCAEVIAYFRGRTPEVSGFAATVEGRTINLVSPRFKRRLDVTIEDPALITMIHEKMVRRLFPALKRAFNWEADKIERFLICRYGEDDNGFFSSHRDDATAGTAHRQFAVTINLNPEDYDGGCLRFPEFGRRTYAPPLGGATVFCCSLLHEVTPVTRGERFAFVPFLFNAAGESIRNSNLAYIG